MATIKETKNNEPVEIYVNDGGVHKKVAEIAANGDMNILGDIASSGTISATGDINTNGKFEGFGIPPIGSIIAWISGAFTGSGNPQGAGFSSVLAANNISGANSYVIACGYKVCDGTQINDVASPLNGLYVPDIDDSRFLAGATISGDDSITDAGIAGGTSGSNTAVHNHSHTHNHNINDISHTVTNNSANTGYSQSSSQSVSVTGTIVDHYHDLDGYGGAWIGNDSSGNIWINRTNLSTIQYSSVEFQDSGSGQCKVNLYNSSGINYPARLGGRTSSRQGSPSQSCSGTFNNNHRHPVTSNVSVSDHISLNTQNDTSNTDNNTSGTENRPKYLSCFYLIRIK